jgi:hypothetical protein
VSDTGWDDETGHGLLNSAGAVAVWHDLQDASDETTEPDPETDEEDADVQAPTVDGLFVRTGRDQVSVRFRTDELASAEVCDLRRAHCATSDPSQRHSVTIDANSRFLSILVTDLAGNESRLPPIRVRAVQ